MEHELTEDMRTWLDRQWEDSRKGVWIPYLIGCFVKEFGYKRSGIPDSMPVEDASRLVNQWIEERQIKI
tara:strand:+ start:517 stop:723 length:207 start_codon:yes stop_codon:yes gene_type:complete